MRLLRRLRPTQGVLIYVAVVTPIVLLALALIALGFTASTSLSIALLVAIAFGMYATWKIRAWYLATAEPRSIFYGMLVSALEVKVAFAGWVGYLVAANVLATIGFTLPLPEQWVRQAITGVSAIAILLSAVYYAVTIELQRRRELARRRRSAGS